MFAAALIAIMVSNFWLSQVHGDLITSSSVISTYIPPATSNHHRHPRVPVTILPRHRSHRRIALSVRSHFENADIQQEITDQLVRPIDPLPLKPYRKCWPRPSSIDGGNYRSNWFYKARVEVIQLESQSKVTVQVEINCDLSSTFVYCIASLPHRELQRLNVPVEQFSGIDPVTRALPVGNVFFNMNPLKVESELYFMPKSLDKRSCLYLDHVSSDGRYRSIRDLGIEINGIGTALMATVFDMAMFCEYKEVVWNSMPGAYKFYEKLGFRRKWNRLDRPMTFSSSVQQYLHLRHLAGLQFQGSTDDDVLQYLERFNIKTF